MNWGITFGIGLICLSCIIYSVLMNSIEAEYGINYVVTGIVIFLAIIILLIVSFKISKYFEDVSNRKTEISLDNSDEVNKDSENIPASSVCEIDSMLAEENNKNEQSYGDWGCGCCAFGLLFAAIIFGRLCNANSNFGSENILKYSIFAIVLLFLIIIIACLSIYAKDIVIKVGRKTLDICTAIDVVLTVICLGIGFFQCADEQGISPFIWWYVLGSIVIFLITLLANYTLYLLIDIRDSLKKLADNVDNKGE